MQTAPQSNAMAEIALALAMAFFSILVLSMVSMGAGFAEGPAPASRDGVAVRAPAGRAGSAGGAEAASRDAIVIYYRGRFLDGSLGALRVEALDPAGPLVLAVSPELSVTEALAARDRLGVEGLTVTTLDEAWLKALKEMTR